MGPIVDGVVSKMMSLDCSHKRPQVHWMQHISFAVLLSQAVSFRRLDSSVFGKSKLCLMFNSLSALFEKQIAMDIFRSRQRLHSQ